MATLAKAISKNLFDEILPTFGNERRNLPVWNEGQMMFICDEYESDGGNRYYRGLRFSDRIAVVEKVGQSHNWTYIDGIELYAFNGKSLNLIQKKEYDKVYRTDDFVKTESVSMVKAYLAGVLKAQRVSMDKQELENQARAIVESCYKSFLDFDYNVRLTQIVKTIDKH